MITILSASTGAWYDVRMSIGTMLYSWRTVVVALVGIVSLTTLVLTPLVTHAALVTCGTDIKTYTNSSGQICTSGECTVCDMQKLAQQVLNFCFILMIILAALLFVNAGFKYLMAASDPGGVSQAHKIFTNTLIGIVIILCAWLIVDTILKQLAGSSIGSYGPWNEILCKNSGSEHCVDKLGAIDVNVNQTTTAAKTECGNNGVGGYCSQKCSALGAEYTSRTGTTCENNKDGTVYCCVPNTSQRACTLSSNKSGTCQTRDKCGGAEQNTDATCNSMGSGNMVCCDMASQYRKCSDQTEGSCVANSTDCGSGKSVVSGLWSDCGNNKAYCCAKGSSSQSSATGGCKTSAWSETWGDLASTAQCVCSKESYNGNDYSLGDKCTGDGTAVSIGVMQINISSNNVLLPDGRNCKNAFTSAYTYSNKTCSLTQAGKDGLYNACVTYLQDNATSVKVAKYLYDDSKTRTGNGWKPWEAQRSGCGLY